MLYNVAEKRLQHMRVRVYRVQTPFLAQTLINVSFLNYLYVPQKKAVSLDR